MSLTYTTLQSTILDMAKRGELTAKAPDFVRLAESMIRRSVRAFERRQTLVEADRNSEGVYDLDGYTQAIRGAWYDGRTLENVGIANIRKLTADSDVLQYALSGQTIEFRGVPGTDAEIELVTFGWPAPLATTATNSLLDDHEDLYVYGGLYHLYQYTQDIELAREALSSFDAAVRAVNALNSMQTGGQSSTPAYNFGHQRIGSGY